MKKLLLPVAATIAVACSNTAGDTGGAAANNPSAAGTGFTAVSQILSTNCLPCHSATTRKGGLSIMSYADVMKGGEDGAVVVPGDPDKSLIVEVLKGPVQEADEKIPQMPMKRAPLSEADQKVIADWIRSGAKES